MGGKGVILDVHILHCKSLCVLYISMESLDKRNPICKAIILIICIMIIIMPSCNNSRTVASSTVCAIYYGAV